MAKALKDRKRNRFMVNFTDAEARAIRKASKPDWPEWARKALLKAAGHKA